MIKVSKAAMVSKETMLSKVSEVTDTNGDDQSAEESKKNPGGTDFIQRRLCKTGV